MPTLTILLSDLKRLCAIDAGDTSEDAALTALLLAEQPVHEYALDPALLAASAGDSGLRATLTLGVAEAMAGSFLQVQARALGVTDDIHIGPLTIKSSAVSPVELGRSLAAQGTARLAPFARASKSVAASALGTAPGDDGTHGATLSLQATTGSIFDPSPFDDGAWESEGGRLL
jgi:hypothetical protein